MAIKDSSKAHQEPCRGDEEWERNRNEIIDYFKKLHAKLDIVTTTTSPAGHVIDWIPIESQGRIAKPPPHQAHHPKLGHGVKNHHFKEDLALGELECEGAELGPEGTVPIPRMDSSKITGEKSLAQFLSKETPPTRKARDGTLTAEDATPGGGDGAAHRYALGYQFLKCYGGQGYYSCFDPAVEAYSSESLIQTGLLNSQLEALQSVELGWQVNPILYGDSQPHLFTYFRTAGSASGPGIGGYNTDTGDWKQYDTTIFPKSTFTPLSTVGDPSGQRRIQIATQLWEGNWWVWCQGRWIGYYEASLFQAAAPDSEDTLASYADTIGYWGEIADYSAATAPTTTDMGSGQFPDLGFGWSAYMHNLGYSPDETGLKAFWFDGSADTRATDPNWYNIVADYTIDSTWGSYMFLGGPGAG